MDLESIYLELTKEGQDYYRSLRQSLIKHILNIVSDEYEFKLKKLKEKKNKVQDEYKEKIKSITDIDKRYSELDQWINDNQSVKNTNEYNEKIKEIKELYFEKKDSKRNNEDAYF